jgi:hypothetical protein
MNFRDTINMLGVFLSPVLYWKEVVLMRKERINGIFNYIDNNSSFTRKTFQQERLKKANTYSSLNRCLLCS